MKLFVFPVVVSVLTIVGALILRGTDIALTLFVLAILEVSLSFDNAVINAMWLQRMNRFWQRIFLTIGILIAVFGMRLVFPVIVVALSAHISLGKTADLAVHDANQYAHILEGAHHQIAAFGAVFLGMIFLSWVTEEREIKWLNPLERPLARLGKLDDITVVIMLGLIAVVAPHELFAGVLALVTYLLVSTMSGYFEGRNEEAEDEPQYTQRRNGGLALIKPVAAGGIGAFLYLELMDASFSFDGVMAAFAVTNNIEIIALGLGIGAIYIRTMTVFLTNKGVLQDLIHLEHGAHWAIGLLSGLMFASLYVTISEMVTALFSLGAIGAALVTSLIHNRRVDARANMAKIYRDDQRRHMSYQGGHVNIVEKKKP